MSMVDRRRKFNKSRMLNKLKQEFNVSKSCQAVGISHVTHYQWLKEDEDYADAVENLKFKDSKIERLEKLKSTPQYPSRLKNICSLYIIKAGDFIKVGITSNIKRRIHDIQTSNPFKIEILCVLRLGEKSLVVEKGIHSALKDHKTEACNEWFHYNDFTKEIVNRIPDTFGKHEIDTTTWSKYAINSTT